MLLTRSKTIRLLSGAIETLSLLSLKLFLKNRANWRQFPGRVFREYVSASGGDRWRSVPIERLVPGISGRRITVEYLDGEGIYTPVDELVYLALTTLYLNPSSVFEIGTFRGRTALNFALNSAPTTRVYTLDLPPASREGTMRVTNSADAAIIAKSATGIDYRGKPGAEKIVQLFGDSLQFDFSPYYGRMDLVFIDGAHHYQAVMSDTEQAIKMLSPRGVIIWHDFANYGDYNDVTRAILDRLPKQRIIQIANSQLACYQQKPLSTSTPAPLTAQLECLH